MAKITYIEFSGKERVLEIAPGVSVMQGAVSNVVLGIIGDCGGACMCGTCHVYIDPAWVDKVGEKSETEKALLEDVCGEKPNSRLGCQIKVTEALDGLVVRVPERQV